MADLFLSRAERFQKQAEEEHGNTYTAPRKISKAQLIQEVTLYLDAADHADALNAAAIQIRKHLDISDFRHLSRRSDNDSAPPGSIRDLEWCVAILKADDASMDDVAAANIWFRDHITLEEFMDMCDLPRRIAGQLYESRSPLDSIYFFGIRELMKQRNMSREVALTTYAKYRRLPGEAVGLDKKKALRV